MTHDQIERRLRHLTTYAICTTLGLVFVVLGAAAPATAPWLESLRVGTAEADTVRAAVLEVERINVVQADGRLAVVVSNGDRMPGPIFRGDEFSPEISQARRGAAGVVFYNADGTESGGLVHRTVRSGSGYQAVGGLTFDQFEQDQVVGLGYSDDGASRSAGLQIWDQPTTVTIKDKIDAMVGTQSGDPVVREASEARAREMEAAGEMFGPQRIFVGSINRSAQITLQDTRGAARIRLVVDSLDVARLTFYDRSGKVVQQFPAE